MSVRPIGVTFAWPIMGKHDVIHKTTPIGLSLMEDRATATGKTYRRFRKVRTRGFGDMRSDRHTDIQIRSSQYCAPLPGGTYKYKKLPKLDLTTDAEYVVNLVNVNIWL